MRNLQVKRIGMTAHYKSFFDPMSFNQLLSSIESNNQIATAQSNIPMISNGFSQEVYSMRTPSEVTSTSNNGTVDMENETDKQVKDKHDIRMHVY